MTSAEIRQSFLDFFRSKGHSIVPSSSLMPDAPNLLFTNAGMNQFVPIFLGQAVCPYSPRRAADTQKCIRAGGKHNDLEDVGLDTYHHTFFEMLGNWSFGDYFKKEAIEWAWELVTGVWECPQKRLYATVYQPGTGEPGEFDQEAYDHWAHLFTAAGLDPKVHIRTGGKKDNFWMMGETGPCGPCSEIHVDLTPEGETKGALVNRGTPECIEIWNLVFMEFNANPDGSFTPLPARNVDTGMGFERVTGIIQCTRNFADFTGIISNYESDIFRPLFARLEQLSGKQYGSTLPTPGTSGHTSQERTDVAFRVVADHIRTLTFAIADGIEPGNTDRNYVLRRILRRAVRYGRALGFHEPFFYKLVDVLADTMGGVFPEIRAKQEHIKDVIRLEEEAFNRTLDTGIQIFEEGVELLETMAASARSSKAFGTMRVRDESGRIRTPEVGYVKRRDDGSVEGVLAGDFAFRLYDTYGFPLDLTELMARERGFDVDAAGFNRLMDEQRARARKARKTEVVELSQIETSAFTTFVGYDKLETPAKVLEIVSLKNQMAVILDTSVCYAEMGGQVGDTGELSQGSRLWRVVNTQRSGNAWLHLIEASGEEPDVPTVGGMATLSVERERRLAIQRHHTVTHLLHWALREIVGRDTSQKGSFVGPDKLTFDFNSAPLTQQQVAGVERLVNERILENATVSWVEVPYAEVKRHPNVRQFFGEKYGDIVRVVQIGGQPGQLNGYSMELCGGTHCRAVGEIGLFRIVAENAIASGVRRIEAVAGLEAYRRAGEEMTLLKNVAGKVNSPISELERRIENLLAQQKRLEKELKNLVLKQAAEVARGLLAKAQIVNGIPAIIENVGVADGETLQAIVNELKGRFRGAILLGAVANGAVVLVAAVSPEFTAKAQAGKIIQQIAPVVGGKGGGRPDNARGGGRDVSKLDEALAMARTLSWR
jgi:alanyl-tRNA synthetase